MLLYAYTLLFIYLFIYYIFVLLLLQFCDHCAVLKKSFFAFVMNRQIIETLFCFALVDTKYYLR